MNMMTLNELNKQVDSKELNLNAGLSNLMSIMCTQYPDVLHFSGNTQPLTWINGYCIYSYNQVVKDLQNDIYTCKTYQSRLLKCLSHTLINVIKDSDKTLGCDWFVLAPVSNHSYRLLTIKNFDNLIKETEQMIKYYHNLP